jgi:hypothetical protein
VRVLVANRAKARLPQLSVLPLGPLRALITFHTADLLILLFLLYFLLPRNFWTVLMRAPQVVRFVLLILFFFFLVFSVETHDYKESRFLGMYFANRWTTEVVCPALHKFCCFCIP